ncbi:MAG: hypothetical protein IPO21_14750 [Bacteroidales bacterium]|nr:hypothetical protein [Bacteroidales bacterium]
MITVLLLSISRLHCQVIEYDDILLNCDTAYTTLEYRFCASYKLYQSIAKYDSIISKINTCLDLLIIQDSVSRQKALEEDSTISFENWTDYKKIKEIFTESDSLFILFVTNESSILGELYGNGQERSIAENGRMQELYDHRIKDLIEFCNINCDIE